MGVEEMKKLILLFISVLVCTGIIGCSKIPIQEVETLEELYFSLADTLEQNENLTIDKVGALLEINNYEKGEIVENQNNKIRTHIFTVGKERLVISEDLSSEGKVLELAYNKATEVNSIWLGYKPKNLLLILEVGDIKVYEDVCEILDNKESKFLNSYQEISRGISKEKAIKIDDVTSILNLEPSMKNSVDSVSLKELIRYGFQEEESDEVLAVYMDKDSKNINKVVYASNDTSSVMKSTISRELTTKKNTPIYSIESMVEDISIQREILTLIFE